MNYEERYKQAIKAAKKELHCCGSLNCDAAKQIFRLFPELRESEDEKIRKEIISYIKSSAAVTNKDWIAWLEKQGEQKPADKKIRGKDELFDHRYAQYLIEAMHQTYMIQWKGDNLKEVIDFTGKSKNFDEWFKSWDEYETYVHSHGDIFKLFCIDGSHYEVPVGAWIIKTPDGCNIPSRFKFIQKPAEWSEEDEKMFDKIYSMLWQYGYVSHPDVQLSSNDAVKLINWLKSIKPQIHWKPSEEQMYILEWLTTNVLDAGAVGKKAKEVLSTLIEQLKSL